MMMYDELVKELRDSAEWADRLALLMGRAEGDVHAPVMRKAADAIEELSKYVNYIGRLKCEGWYLQQTKHHDGYQEAEEVYGQYSDTAGNYHWCGTHSGEHTITAEEGE